jgi:hypothetical protein
MCGPQDKSLFGSNMTEHQMQVKLVQYIRTFYPDILIFAIPNGAAVSGKNRLRLYKEGLLSGVPDIFIATPLNGFNGLFIELKTLTGIESNNQKRIREVLINNGYLVYVARQLDTALNLIEDYINGH